LVALQKLKDGFWSIIALISGWRPGQKTKTIVEWTGLITGAILGVWGIIEWMTDDGALTRKDFTTLTRPIATKDDIAALRQELLEKLSRRPFGEPLAGQDEAKAGLEKDLDKAIETLLAAGRTDALKDKTGEAAEAALDELIAGREAARQRVARDEADLYRQKGAIAFLQDTGKAISAYTRATELDPDNPEGWNELGALKLRVGELSAAAESMERVLALGNRASDQTVIAAATGNLGVIYRRRGDLDRAEAMHRQSLAINEQLGRKTGMASQYGNLGLVFHIRGDLDQAEAMHRKSLVIEEELGRKDGMAIDYGNLGVIHRRRGDVDGAEAMHRRSLAINEQLGRKEGLASQYSNLALIFQMRGDLDGAEAMHRKSLAIEEELGRKDGMAAEYANLGSISEKRGNMAQACAQWRKALDIYAQMGVTADVQDIEALLREANCPAA
jgi:tetratricopeptide (TPR) repeat protein